MHPAARWSLMTLWLVLLTLALGRFWFWVWTYHTPYFPNLPESVWGWLSALYGAYNDEEVEEVETLVVLVCSFVQACLITWASLALVRRFRP